jgi:HSP20 family protein
MPDKPSTKTEILGQILSQVDRHMNSLFGRSFSQWPGETVWQPAVNLYETGDRFLLCMDLAAVDHAKIDVQVQNNRLTVQGKRGDISPKEPVRVHVMEIDHGNFRREVEFPESVDADRIQASYREGFLWIELPKKSCAT